MLKFYMILFALILNIFLFPSSFANTISDEQESINMNTLFDITQKYNKQNNNIFFDLPAIISQHTGKKELYWGHFEYIPTNDEKIIFELTNYGNYGISEIIPFLTKDITLLDEKMNISFSLANIHFIEKDKSKTLSYWGTLQYQPNDKGKLFFKVASYGGFKRVIVQINKQLTEGIVELYDANNIRIAQYSGATNEAGQYFIDIADKYQPTKAKLYISQSNSTKMSNPEIGDCSNTQCNITFSERSNEYFLSVHISGEGQINSESDPIVLATINSYEKWQKPNTILKLIATPAKGYEVLSWLGCNLVSDTQNECTIIMDKDKRVKVNFQLLPPENLIVVPFNDKILFSWETIKGAVGYRIIDNARNVVVANTKNNSITIPEEKKKNGVIYHYQIAAIDKEGQLGKYSQMAVALTSLSSVQQTPTNLFATVGDGEITLIWDNASNKSYFQIVDEKGYIVVPVVKTNTYTFKNLTNYKSYSYRVASIGSLNNINYNLNRISPYTKTITATPRPNPSTIDYFTNNNTLKINDTGIKYSVAYRHPYKNYTTCVGVTSKQQDCGHGRDVTHNDDSDGHAGFSFTKIAADGSELPASASTWSCVRDNVTKLIWESKNTTTEVNKGLHFPENIYTWDIINKIIEEDDIKYSEAKCNKYDMYQERNFTCNTSNFIKWVNLENLCGYTDWRLPSVKELLSIVNYNVSNPSSFEPDIEGELPVIKPTIDTNYFPGTQTDLVYWTNTPDSNYEDNGRIKAISFLGYTPMNASHDYDFNYIRLVRRDP